jgi:hypothetical protein
MPRNPTLVVTQAVAGSSVGLSIPNSAPAGTRITSPGARLGGFRSWCRRGRPATSASVARWFESAYSESGIQIADDMARNFRTEPRA